MVKILELKQDRSLLKTDFDGYKLSLQPVPIIRQDTESIPLLRSASESQYSYLQTELFAMQNLLIQDPWERDASYFVDQNGKILKCRYNEDSGRPNKPELVTKLPKSLLDSNPGDFNISFQFISEKFCLLCDGKQTCVLFDTGDRFKTSKWKEIFRSKINNNSKNFVLKDCRLDTFDSCKIINCIFQRIKYNGSIYITELIWCVLKQNETDWILNVKDILSGKGSLQYCALEPNSAALILASNVKFNFNSVVQNSKIIQTPIQELTEVSDSNYNWCQNNESITITVSIGHNAEKDAYNIQCTSDKITVQYKNIFIIDGTFFSEIDPQLTIWTWGIDFIKITLIKKTLKLFWEYLIENGPKQCSSNFDNKPISNLEATLEDCDFAPNSEDEYVIERFELISKEITHKIVLGNSVPLFSTNLRPGFPAALVTRYGVDASIWLQQYNSMKPTEWCFRHEGNLHAFGYIQASKQQKKFINCASDLSYSVICESHRHVFIYKPINVGASGLRNRNGTQITIGKQSLVTLEDIGEVLGIQCCTNVIILLLEKCILYLQINNF